MDPYGDKPLLMDSRQTMPASKRKFHLHKWMEKKHNTVYKHLDDVYKVCSEFMYRGCNQRAPSHNHEHMFAVAKDAQSIATIEGRLDLVVGAVVVGVLHDYADSKYDSDGDLNSKLVRFLNETFDDLSASYILKTIEFISYSKEKTYRDLHKHITDAQWLTDLPEWTAQLTPSWLLIRHIVSDADKLLASGTDGFWRTWGYKGEAYSSTHCGKSIPEDLRKEQMFEIYSNRLSRTHTHLMHTDEGRRRALIRYNEMKAVADRYFDGYHPYNDWANNFIIPTIIVP